MAFNPELGSTSPAVLLDNAERLDKLVNGPAADVPDRGGDPLYSWRQMMAKNDEVRQNLIPLSKQYMTLAAAQADIVNIPVGSTTYYRSPDTAGKHRHLSGNVWCWRNALSGISGSTAG